MKRLLMLTLGFAILFSTAFSQDKRMGMKVKADEITVTTPDGLTMHGWFTPSPDVGAPLLVLLPMMGSTHESYGPLIHGVYVAAAEGNDSTRLVPNILSVDLRGHGASVIGRRDTLSYQTMSDAEFEKYPSDVKALIDRVFADKSLRINREDIIIAGASIGANTAIMTAPLLKGVTKVAMLSPGLNYRSLQPVEALKEFTGKMYIGVSENDTYAAESSQKLAAMARERTTIHIYKGRNHGTNIINRNETAMNQLAEWLLK